MDKQIASGLRFTFVVHGIVGLLYGLAQLLLPEAVGKLFGIAVPDPIFWRLVGAATLGFTATSWLALRATAWEEVRITVLAEIVWPALGTLVMLWALLSGAWPVTGWLNAIILGGFAVTFSYFYFEEVRVIMPRLGMLHR
jgi:hypothetical protein